MATDRRRFFALLTAILPATKSLASVTTAKHKAEHLTDSDMGQEELRLELATRRCETCKYWTRKDAISEWGTCGSEYLVAL
jgi:hypothetical protein